MKNVELIFRRIETELLPDAFDPNKTYYAIAAVAHGDDGSPVILDTLNFSVPNYCPAIVPFDPWMEDEDEDIHDC